MKRIVSVTMFSACLLAVSPVVRAQDCSNLTNYDYRGTYTISGSGWADVSKLLAGIPGLPPMPAGFVPMSWLGVETLDGHGGATGWVSVNSAGTQMSASFVDKTYSVQPDCSLRVTFSMKINELPGNPVIGPFLRIMVPVFKPGSLELHMIWKGNAPGAPTGPAVDSGIAYRISM